MTDRRLPVVVIYHDPLDHPGRWVTRRQWAGRGQVEVEAEPLAVVDSLEQARDAVPAGMVCLPRSPDDEPQIVELWV